MEGTGAALVIHSSAFRSADWAHHRTCCLRLGRGILRGPALFSDRLSSHTCWDTTQPSPWILDIHHQPPVGAPFFTPFSRVFSNNPKRTEVCVFLANAKVIPALVKS